MSLFLGYDPGGKAKNGVAAIRLASDSIEVVNTATVLDASEALLWLTRYASGAQALGVDTLLAWSPKGGRACDDALRRRYGGNSIVAQNSLYSAMTLNGAIVARRIGLPVYESHPKLLLKSNSKAAIHNVYQEAVTKNGTDHEADAIVAAWCAAMGHTRKWTVELYSDIEDDIELVVPEARYPWFETIESPHYLASRTAGMESRLVDRKLPSVLSSDAAAQLRQSRHSTTHRSFGSKKLSLARSKGLCLKS